MPKLRNADTDIAKFTQWLGRKCRNHHPLEELENPGKQRPNIYRAENIGRVSISGREKNELIYQFAGRAFLIRVEEIEQEHELDSLLAAASPVGR